MQITTVGLDLAKNVFQVHGVNEHGKVVLRKQLRFSGQGRSKTPCSGPDSDPGQAAIAFPCPD